jgi:hypothetical protein
MEADAAADIINELGAMIPKWIVLLHSPFMSHPFSTAPPISNLLFQILFGRCWYKALYRELDENLFCLHTILMPHFKSL